MTFASRDALNMPAATRAYREANISAPDSDQAVTSVVLLCETDWMAEAVRAKTLQTDLVEDEGAISWRSAGARGRMEYRTASRGYEEDGTSSNRLRSIQMMQPWKNWRRAM